MRSSPSVVLTPGQRSPSRSGPTFVQGQPSRPTSSGLQGAQRQLAGLQNSSMEFGFPVVMTPPFPGSHCSPASMTPLPQSGLMHSEASNLQLTSQTRTPPEYGPTSA